MLRIIITAAIWESVLLQPYSRHWIQKEKSGSEQITVTTQNLGISIKNVTTIYEKPENVYLSLTGDQCALTNIHIIRSE